MARRDADGGELSRGTEQALTELSNGRVRELVMSVEVEGRVETVVVKPSEDGLVVLCTHDDPRFKDAAREALSRLSGGTGAWPTAPSLSRSNFSTPSMGERAGEGRASVLPDGSVRRMRRTTPPPGELQLSEPVIMTVERTTRASMLPLELGKLSMPRMSAIPPEPTRPEALGRALADALEAMVTAVVRMGLKENSDAPTFVAAVEQLARAAPTPMPLSLERWVGRLKHALERNDLSTTGRLLDGAVEAADALRGDGDVAGALAASGSGSSARRARAERWLGVLPPESSMRSSEIRLVEVGRESIAGMSRGAIERRYLLCLDTGELYREERRRGRGEVASVGPCPRRLTVGLARIESGPAPRRIHILQYEVQCGLTVENLERVHETAFVQFGEAIRLCQHALQEDPALSEPTVVVAVHGVSEAAGRPLLDKDGVALHLAAGRRPDLVGAFYDHADRARVNWVLGRMVPVEGGWALLPLSAGFGHGASRFVRRLA